MLSGLRSLYRKMPVTRSSTRSRTASTVTTPTLNNKLEPKASEGKSKSASAKKPRSTKSSPAVLVSSVPFLPPPRFPPGVEDEEEIIPAVLTFSFEEAKSHLIKADPRFDDVFKRLPCRPYQELEQVHPFMSLASSILGQQISWLAARSIKHKFIRLYNQSIPEKYSDYSGSFFPTPYQVANTDVSILRTAGLSGRKAEYIQDLAARFSDGRLTTSKLLGATDKELFDMLIAVKGIGPWTVDMFAIFSLRRPNILPVGDLGVQRGLMQWILSLHSETYNVAISPKKQTKKAVKKKNTSDSEDENEDDDALPDTMDPAEDESAILPVPETQQDSAMPPTFTPSIQKILHSTEGFERPSLPEGMTVSSLKSRLDSKKKTKGGALLTPKEMEELTQNWHPYRSIPVYYMWALMDSEST